MWDLTGLTPLTAPDLRADHFFDIAKKIDQLRRERDKPQPTQG